MCWCHWCPSIETISAEYHLQPASQMLVHISVLELNILETNPKKIRCDNTFYTGEYTCTLISNMISMNSISMAVNGKFDTLFLYLMESLFRDIQNVLKYKTVY